MSGARLHKPTGPDWPAGLPCHPYFARVTGARWAGTTGSNRYGARAAETCSVLMPSKIRAGRSLGSVWVKGPQPVIGYFMFDSTPAGPGYT